MSDSLRNLLGRALPAGTQRYYRLDGQSRSPRLEQGEPFLEKTEGQEDSERPQDDSRDGLSRNSASSILAKTPSAYKALAALAVLSILAYLFTSLRPSSGNEPGSYSRAIVLASYSEQDTRWTSDVPKEWNVYRYVNDDPEAEYTTPVSQGREAMGYLTYIIDHYDELPEIVVFHHGSYRSWHQSAPAPFLFRALNLDEVKARGYVNLRCIQWPACEPVRRRLNTTKTPDERWNKARIRALYNLAFQEGDSWYDSRPEHDPSPLTDGLPETIAAPCCAQFAVTRETIRAKPLAFWTRLRQPLLEDFERVQGFSEEKDRWAMGIPYERLWHIFFGMKAITCVSYEECQKKIYQNKVRCDKAPRNWREGHQLSQVHCEFSKDGTWADGGWGDTLKPDSMKHDDGEEKDDSHKGPDDDFEAAYDRDRENDYTDDYSDKPGQPGGAGS